MKREYWFDKENLLSDLDFVKLTLSFLGYSLYCKFVNGLGAKDYFEMEYCITPSKITYEKHRMSVDSSVKKSRNLGKLLREVLSEEELIYVNHRSRFLRDKYQLEKIC